MKSIRPQLLLLIAIVVSSFNLSLRADVPTPAPAPPIPAGYCTTIANELSGDLGAFNTLLSIPPIWNPVPGGPTIFAGNLSQADANTGPSISGPDYIQAVQTQLQELQAMGVKGILVQVGFPVLYEPFYGSEQDLDPYVTFYSQVAAAVKAAGLKLIVEDNVLLSDDIESGWTNLNAFYNTYANNWAGYEAARAAHAAFVAQTMQPDYMVLAEEPDGEATQTGQGNLNIPTDAADMIQQEITAVKSATNPTVPNTKLGAGFGSWQPNSTASLAGYIAAYILLPLDYIDFHVYPINTELTSSFIDNTLLIASAAAGAGLPVAISEAFLWKMENSEWNVQNGQYFRARQPFSFWQPLDESFFESLQALAAYTNMLYMAPEGPQYLFAYQTYGGTTANGGAATCTCTTQTCNEQDIVQTENTVSNAANQVGDYSLLGFSYYSQLVVPPDTTNPSTPTWPPPPQPGYSQITITWNPSTEKYGVAGYNVYRCTPVAPATTCTGVYLNQTSGTSYTDSNLTSNTTYVYTVSAFSLANTDMAPNQYTESPLSAPLSLTTPRTSAESPTGLTATAVSPKEISLAWDAPSDTTGLDKYLIFSSTSSNSLVQIGTAPSSKNTFTYQPLQANTRYYFGVEAVESGIDSSMSNLAWTQTLPLPNSPTSVTATPSSTSKIALTWDQSTVSGGLTVDEWQVWQGTVPGQLTKIATVKAASYNNTSLEPGTTYYYEIVAVDSGNDDSVPSNQVSAATYVLPPAPSGLSATEPSAAEIVISWNWTQPSNGLAASRYLVDCGTSPSSLSQVGTAQAPATSFTYRSATPATEYYCDVTAVDTANDDSAPSSIITATTPPDPNAPTDVVATADSATKVVVTWNETLPRNGLPIQNYTIYRGLSPEHLSDVATRTTTSYTDTTVTGGITYYYAIVANDTGHDKSVYSEVATVTTP